MRWPWQKRPATPTAPRCGVCKGARVTRIVYIPRTDSRVTVLYCVKCDHITRKA